MKTVIILLICLMNFIVASAWSGGPEVKLRAPVTAHFDSEKSVAQLLAGIPLTKRRKADSYTVGGHWLILWNSVNVVLIAWIFLFQGLSAYLKKISAGKGL